MKQNYPTMRLDKLLANLGYGTRQEIHKMARCEIIELDGDIVTHAELRVSLTPDMEERLLISDESVDPMPGMMLMLHKPVGVTCSHKEAGPLVYDFLPGRWQHRDPPLSTVGRLDKETSGLLLLTDDGALLHRIISPKSQVAKRYQVVLDRPLRGDEAAALAAGTLMLGGEDKPLLPVEMLVRSEREATVTLHEGRYHQVRRMFAALGNHVVALHRDRVGGLNLPGDLAAGEWRVMGAAEVAAVTGIT